MFGLLFIIICTAARKYTGKRQIRYTYIEQQPSPSIERGVDVCECVNVRYCLSLLIYSQRATVNMLHTVFI